MHDPVTPSYSSAEMAAIAKKFYGLEGAIKPLVSYEDQNARLTIGEQQYVLKVANTAAAVADLEFQHAVLGYLEDNFPDGGIPKVMENTQGGTIAMHEGHAVRLLTFVPGEVLSFADRTQKLHTSLGRYMGQFNVAMQDFTHPGALREDFIWNLDNVMLVKPYIRHIALQENRERVERFFKGYEARVLPKLKSLRKAVIHQDANDHNVLVNGAGEVSGLIDFGDVTWGSQINELAVTMAYALQNTDDTLGAAKDIIRAYDAVFPLEADERDILFDLIAMRIVQSVTLSSRDAKDDPDNAYLVISQAPGFELLEKLEAINAEFLCIFTKHIVGAPSEGQTISDWLSTSADCADLFPFSLKDHNSLAISMTEGAEGSEHIADQKAYGTWLNEKMEAGGAKYAIGLYGEDRSCYTSANFVDTASGEPRSVHLGIDLFVPVETPLYAPLGGKVFSVHDNAGALDYGPTIILKHKVPDTDISFYTLYGHLARKSLSMVRMGDDIKAGQQVGLVGDIEVNGGWTPHLHLQIMTSMLGNQHDFPGACEASRRAVWQEICLDPELLLGFGAKAS